MTSPKRLKVINLFGAPGKGKSAARSGVFWLMKACHLSVEEVSEYAKYLVLSGRQWQLREEQLYLFSKQHHKQLIVQRSGYDFAVTDSPLQLCSFYAPPGYFRHFDALVDEAYEEFDNINFFVTRDTESEGTVFEDNGRAHDRDAAARAEGEMREFLARKNVSCIDLPVDLFSPWRVLDVIAPGLAPSPVFMPAKVGASSK